MVRIAVVGLGFGAEFAPIYQAHPDVESVAICDADEERLNRVGDHLNITERFTTLDAILHDGSYDAVHLLTPVPLHVEQTLKVLGAGLHCACAVPMATTLEDLARIIAAQQRSGKQYMMMETCAYTRQFLYAQELHRRGEFGTITFLRSIYYQDLEGNFPAYWRAQPPMHYGTHAIAPLLALMQTRAERVVCLGSGRLRPDIQMLGGNEFPLQCGLFQLAGTDVVAEVTRSWFQVARPYAETFSVFGDLRGFDWMFEHDDPFLYTLEPVDPTRRGRPTTTERVRVPYRADLYPRQLAPFAEGGHHGSHPHLAHEFVRSVVEGRAPAIDAYTSADWTAPGICANESSLRGGEPVAIPDFRAAKRC
jgi:predicted dehydrogenase